MIVFGYGFSGSLALLIGAAAIIGFGLGIFLGFKIAQRGVQNVLDFGKPKTNIEKTEEMA